MKIKMTWKDPEWAGDEPGGFKFDYQTKKWSPEAEALFEELDKAGFGEYINIEYDTETKQTRILPQ